MIRVALRFDDPSAVSLHDLEEDIFSALDAFGVPATVAAIPHALDDAGHAAPITADAVPHLVKAARAGIIEVAQHGYAHRSLNKTTSGANSEFFGVPAQRQEQMIDEGRRRLGMVFGRPPAGFVPPWNTYDEATLEILARQGFQYISASFGPHVPKPSPLKNIPRSCQLTMLREALAEARKYQGTKPIIVPIVHHYDFIESGAAEAAMDLPEFRELLGWLKAQPDVHCLRIGELAASTSAAATHSAMQRHLRKDRLHWRLQRRLPRHLWMTAAYWRYLL